MSGAGPAIPSARFVAVEVDMPQPAETGGLLAAERDTAIRDLTVADRAKLTGAGETYRLRIHLHERQLVLDIRDTDDRPIARHVVSLRPFDRVVKDYFLVVESHVAALGAGDRPRIETIDMGRRAIHNEGATQLTDALAGKIALDFTLARSLFTLIAAFSGRSSLAGGEAAVR